MAAAGWDAPQFAVLIAAFLGAAGATFAGLLVSRRQTKAQFRVAMRATRVTAYEEALRLCGHLRDWAERTLPVFQEGGMPDPVLASVEDQIRSRALVTLHGSQTVRESYESFDSAMRAFWAHATEMRHDGAGRNLWLELEAARTVVRTRMIDLGTVMRDDIDLLPGA